MKTYTGIVIHTKMNKTAVVGVERVVVHPVYKKRIKRLKKYIVQDDLGVAAGQKVQFVESRPISRTKKWKIVEVVTGEKKSVKKAKKEKVAVKSLKTVKSAKQSKK